MDCDLVELLQCASQQAHLSISRAKVKNQKIACPMHLFSVKLISSIQLRRRVLDLQKGDGDNALDLCAKEYLNFQVDIKAY
jgi:hypothetical protein